MRTVRSPIFLVFTAMLLFAAQLSSAEDLFPYKTSVRYAKGFTIEYHETYKVVTVLTPWNNADVKFQYLLVQRGTPPPSGYEQARRIDIPVRSFVSMSTTYLANMAQLGVLDTLVAQANFNYVNTPEVRQMIADGKIHEVGESPNINVERLMDLSPDVIMTNALGTGEDAHPKLIEANLNVVINAEYIEQTPLGRSEWIKFLAAFFNKEREADAIFSAIAGRYEAMVANTSRVTHKPTVFLNTPYHGVWWMPGGNSYLAIFLRDAGANYLWADSPSTGSLMLNLEAVYEKAANADYWLHPGQWKRLQDGAADDERFSGFRAFQEDRVYNNNLRENGLGGNDFWESGVTRPDVILADLIKIFHPELAPEHEFVFYQKLE